MVGSDVFKVARVNRIMRALQDEREIPGGLAFLRRTFVAPAADGEIMGRYTGRAHIADLVAEDAKALTYNLGKFTFETTEIPKLKLGVAMPESMIKELASMSQQDVDDPDGILRNWERTTQDAILLGLRQRQESIIIGMHLNGFNYDRLGIKTGDISWGMPSDLNITPSPSWETANTATPVTDILELHRLARVRYGQVFDRMTLSLTAFNKLIAATEFQTYVKNFGLLGQVPSEVLIPTANTDLMKRLALPILGLKEIEIYDERYWSTDEYGIQTSAPFLPINKVIFTSIADDNNPAAYDWANGIVTESRVASLIPGGLYGSFSAPTRGPVGYVTPADMQLNPPGLIYWGVARGFARKHRLQSSAVMTVGSFTDDIAVGEPF